MRRPPLAAALAALGAALAAVGGLAGPARAHQSAVKYVDLTADGARVAVRFTVAPADVTEPLGLPADARPPAAAAATPAAAAHVARWLALALPDGTACPAGPARAELDPDGKLVVMIWEAACPEPVHRLRVDLTAFFAVDARHEALVSIHPPGAAADPHAIRAGDPVAVLHAGQAASLGSWIAYGMGHIFGGPDHVAFVLALLLVVVIGRAGTGGWERRPPLAALRATAVIVTAFTVAHSLTLIAAALGWLRLPGRLVESVIAASILYTVIENVVRPDARRRAALTFAFGLVHGLGFASVLEERLPPAHVVGPLLGFNLGVELGQLLIVGVALPLLAALAHALGAERYRRVALPLAATPLALIATKWLIERAFAIEALPVLGM